MEKYREKISEEEAASYFWSLSDFNAFPVVIWHKDGKIIDANNAFFHLTGYSNLDFEKKGLSWKELTLPEDLHIVEKHIEELKEKSKTDPFEKRIKKKDGTVIRVKLYKGIHQINDDYGVSVILPIN